NVLAVSREPAERLVEILWRRWNQENAFKHGVERWGLNQLDGRRVAEYPPGTVVPNPLRRRIDRALRIARVEEGMARRILARVADGPTRDRANRDLKDALTQQDLLEYVRPHVPPHAPIEKTELAGKLVHHTGELKDVMDAIRIVCANILGGQVKTGQSWTGQIRPVELGAGRGRLPRGGLVAQAVATELGAPASGAALEHVSVVEQSGEEGAGGGVVAEDLAPVLDRAVGGEDGRGTLVAAHDDFEDVLAGGGGQLAHAEVVEDEERDRRDGLDVALAFARELGVGQLLEEDVRLTVEHTVALLDDSQADGLGEVALAGAGRPEQERVLVLGDEAAGRQLEDEAAVHLLVKVEVEGVERAAGVAEAGLLDAPFEEAVLAAHELVGDERRKEVDRRELLGLRV